MQQLSQVKKQLDEELEHLTSSFTQLHAAQSKFRDCLRCVQQPDGKTSALQGTLASIKLDPLPSAGFIPHLAGADEHAHRSMERKKEIVML